jgi:hypothetical protein
MKTFNEWMQEMQDEPNEDDIQPEKRSVFSVTRYVDVERGEPQKTEVIFDGLWSEKEAYEAGLYWLMNKDWPYVALDIRKDGEVIDMVSWEP